MQKKKLSFESNHKQIYRDIVRFALELFEAKQAGIIYGTDYSHREFLPTKR